MPAGRSFFGVAVVADAVDVVPRFVSLALGFQQPRCRSNFVRLVFVGISPEPANSNRDRKRDTNTFLALKVPRICMDLGNTGWWMAMGIRRRTGVFE